MSQSLYEEAIAEARRLTEMAEQNAKNKIIDAVTPQIKRLIEQELLDDPEDLDDVESDEVPDAEDIGGDSADDESVIDLDAMLAGAGSAAAAESPEAAPVPAEMKAPSPAAPKSPSSLKMSDGEVELKIGNVKIEIESEDDVELEENTAKKLSNVLSSSPAARRRLRERLALLEKKVRVLKNALLEARKSGTHGQKQRVSKIYESLVREAVMLKKQAILTEKNTGGRTLETELVNSIIKEMKNMSRRSNRNVFDFLFEGEEEEDTGTEDTGTAEVDVSAAQDALKSLGDALGLDVTVGGGEDESELGDEDESELGDEDEESELGDEDESESSDKEVELDLGEVDTREPYTESEYTESDMKRDGMHESMIEADDDKDPERKKSDVRTDEGKTYEIDESALRHELRRLRSMNEGEAVSAAAAFGGGKAGDEMFVDVDEETLLNALADELGDAPRPKMGSVAESRRTVSEARALRKQVSDYRNVAAQLKKQLVEMNLFNAKLLYANKLMQNRDLSAKQQRAIVEALDNAKTLREAKLLYKSLTSSLNKAVNKGSLTEGRNLRTLGSASKSARSAQPTGLLSEAGGNDRWALLAGIKKD